MNILPRSFAHFRRAKLDREMAEEMRGHIEMEAERNVAHGMPPDEARSAAQRQFGHVDSIQEAAATSGLGCGWNCDSGSSGSQSARCAGLPASALRCSPLSRSALGRTPRSCRCFTRWSTSRCLSPSPNDWSRLRMPRKRPGAQKGRRAWRNIRLSRRTPIASRFSAIFTSTNATTGEEDSPVRSIGHAGQRGFLLGPATPAAAWSLLSPGGTDVGQGSRRRAFQRSVGEALQCRPKIVGREIRLDDQAYTIVGVAPACFEEIFTDMEFFKPYTVRPEESNPMARYAGNVRLIAV